MGSRNMAWAMGTSTGLSDRAFRLLVFMSWHSLDTPKGNMPACVYARGWQHAAELLWPGLAPAAAEQRVRRAMAELVTAGKVKPLGVAARGHRQTYELLP